ncbi:MAG: hypothetical protein M1829_001620 [Trizodia sp. TS-e1964]|nr:MAG: hypothetical protein M1829_001620 [Trizodia sp. TS-e1964]
MASPPPIPPAPAPAPAPGTSITQSGFTITAIHQPMLGAQPIKALSAALGIPIPQEPYGDNLVAIAHPASGWRIEFNARDALDRVNKEAADLHVVCAESWEKVVANMPDIRIGTVKGYDWTFSTDYRGTLTPGSPTTPRFEPSAASIPLDLLRRADPVLFQPAPVYLFADDLDDWGASMLVVKVRVMPARLLLLSRFYLRLEGVVFRLRDTRVYVEFGTGEVLREYTARQEGFGEVEKKLALTRDDSLLRDPGRLPELLDRLSKLMPVVEHVMERVVLGGGEGSSKPEG